MQASGRGPRAPDRIAVGIIRKAHGVRGEASVEPWTGSLDRFGDLHDVMLVSPDETVVRDAKIESSRIHGDRALLKFRGIETPEEIRELLGWTIEIPKSEARKLEPGEYYLHDLVGLTLVDRQGRNRGIVRDVYEGGGGILLAVDGPNGEYDVPFAAEICTQIDVDGGKIIVDLPEGIDDLSHVED